MPTAEPGSDEDRFRELAMSYWLFQPSIGNNLRAKDRQDIKDRLFEEAGPVMGQVYLSEAFETASLVKPNLKRPTPLRTPIKF